MEIKTKFDVAQEVYFMKDNQVKTTTIKEIEIKVVMEYYAWWQEKVNTIYVTKEKWEVVKFWESYIFATKQELLDSL